MAYTTMNCSISCIDKMYSTDRVIDFTNEQVDYIIL
jgi:tRNA A37 threonylcarbamoyladenosine dehydratase